MSQRENLTSLSENQPFAAGTLPRLIRERAQAALESGALQPISTECAYHQEAGIRFVIRVVSNLKRKAIALRLQHDEERRTQRRLNPFLPPDPRLLVAAATASHVCILNKFNVVDHHLLLVTRAFQEQRDPLNRDDFEALWRCLQEIDGLGFYNAGRRAGASQRHKHLQLVSLPLAPQGPAIPLEVELGRLSARGDHRLAVWPFRHQVAELQIQVKEEAKRAAEQLLERYQRLAASLELDLRRTPYNLMVTRRWMLMVPRCRERCGPISVNTLGFAGSFLVRNHEELELVKQIGPIRILSQVAVPEVTATSHGSKGEAGSRN